MTALQTVRWTFSLAVGAACLLVLWGAEAAPLPLSALWALALHSSR
ncbi:hypothetical protein [Caldimonas sp. KR1-144]